MLNSKKFFAFFFAFFFAVCLLIVAAGIGFQFQAPSRSELSSSSDLPAAIREDYYSSQVQPVFANRCVACHSCYNAPCQLNLSSYSGVVRGASKMDPYDFPATKANPPTRLDIDATTEQGWREKDFFSVLSKSNVAHANLGDSTLWTVLSMKGSATARGPKYDSESSRTCASQTGGELENFLSKQPFAGMPYGLPELQTQQRSVIQEWIQRGSPGPSAAAQAWLSEAQSPSVQRDLAQWETMLNYATIKNQISARYFYEHLFIAHVSFDPKSGEFFRLVRARNIEGPADEIATVRPYDEPGGPVFYRFKKIDSVIVAKTHTVFEINNEVRDSYKKDFLESAWIGTTIVMPQYGAQAANPFRTFSMIPRQSRYNFFLKHARYFVMTFMKGPVCRGQTALNVINDQFWLMFVDPKFDVSAQDTMSTKEMDLLMDPPATKAGKVEAFKDLRKRRWQANVLKTQQYAQKNTPFTSDLIWDGDGGKDRNALLTIFRHFDSADIRWGAEGANPKTVWVMDYQIFEDIYYNLVVGYNVFGPLLHQLETRLYMEISRISSEDMFLNFMPAEQRTAIRNSWSHDGKRNLKTKVVSEALKVFGLSASSAMKTDYVYPGQFIQSYVPFRTNDAPGEFLTMLFADRLKNQVQANVDLVDSPRAEGNPATPPREIANVVNGLRRIAGKEAAFVAAFPDLTLLRVHMRSGRDLVYSIVHDKAHANVNLLFLENLRREPAHDTLSIVSNYASSYPNYYLEVQENEIEGFISSVIEMGEQPMTDAEIEASEGKQGMNTRFAVLARRYGVSRFDANFWQTHDWFNAKYRQVEPLEAGLLDLNRYENY